jgi:isopenicillin N synthase-like dioxygenase
MLIQEVYYPLRRIAMPIEQLKTQGFVIVPYLPPLRRAVESTVASWKAFCALPAEVKNKLPYSNNADGVGYEMKDGSGPKGDRKENFDLTLAGKQWLLDAGEKAQNPAALEFVRDAVSLVSHLKPLVLQFAREAEREFGIAGFEAEVDGSEDAFFVRFIHNFEGGMPGEEITTAHTDQSGFTPHLFESSPGLRCLTRGGKWIEMPVSVGETVIIPSMQMQLRSGGKLKALCHRVVATDITAREGRYSAVCFVQLKHTPKYDKARHGRLQEKTPGFNYEMPEAAFADLFKK